jgi:hypothetical protein
MCRDYELHEFLFCNKIIRVIRVKYTEGVIFYDICGAF